MMEDRQNIIADLLLRWEESYEHGDDVPARELCDDHPELVDEVQSKIDDLKKMAWMNQDGEESGDELPDELLSKILGDRYRVESLIAQGGFGCVYKAFDPELERHVAVKVPNRNGETNGQVDSLIAEARRVAKLRHPGIVSVHDVGKDDGRCFIVSELIEGQSLAELIAAKRPSEKDSVLLVAEIAENLQAAHDAGFVHRDIKPANILIDEQGKPLITDFGIASNHDETREAATKGTLPYMAPEQVGNEPQLMDHRCDIYSLGVVLYELLTGESPYSARTPGTLREQILFRPPKPIADDSVTPAVQSVCIKCLSKHRADRFESAADLAQALRDSLTERPVPNFNAKVWLTTFTGALIAVLAFAAGWILRPATSESSSQTIGVAEEGALFDGTKRIVTPIRNFAPCTLEAWIAPNTHDEQQFVIGSDVPGHYGIGIGLDGPHPMSETVRGGQTVHRFKAPINQWTHLAVVFGADETRLYMNGRLGGTSEPTNQPEVVSPFVIGNLGEDQGNMFFTGSIRSVRISEGERFEDDFIPDADFSNDSAEETLLVYDELSFAGDRITDLSGNGNHGYWDSIVDSTINSEQDREIARMILGFGGEIEVLESTGRRRALVEREIPTGDFYLTEVKLLSNVDFNDGHLEKLRGLRRLESVYLSGSSITDDGLLVLQTLETLRQVGVGNSAITNDGIAHLVDLPRLTFLQAGNTKITDEVFVTLSKMKNLRQLLVPATSGLTENAVQEFKEAHPNCLVKFSH